MKDDEDPEVQLQAQRQQKQGEQAKGVEVSKRVQGRRKEKFITAFVAQGDAEKYPCSRDDVLDENMWDHMTGQPSWGASHRGDPLEQLTIQIRRAYVVSTEPSDQELPIDHVLAQDLLDSRDMDLVCRVETMSFAGLAVDRLIAHVESLNFSLSPRLTAAIARRAFLVLLNSHPDHEHPKAADRAEGASDSFEERAAIMEFLGGLSRADAEREARLMEAPSA